MKVFLRVMQVLFGVLVSILLLMVIICIFAKEPGAILGAVVITVITLGLFLMFTLLVKLVGKEKSVKTLLPIQSPQAAPVQVVNTDCKFSGQLISSAGVSLPIKMVYTIAITGDTIKISNQNMVFTLNKAQVVCSGEYGEREKITVNKNSIGRGIAGGMLFGTTGAIVGGLSGAGGKQKERQHFYTFINFKSSSNEDCRLDFETFPDFSFMERTKFHKAVNPTQRNVVQL